MHLIPGFIEIISVLAPDNDIYYLNYHSVSHLNLHFYVFLCIFYHNFYYFRIVHLNVTFL